MSNQNNTDPNIWGTIVGQTIANDSNYVYIDTSHQILTAQQTFTIPNVISSQQVPNYSPGTYNNYYGTFAPWAMIKVEMEKYVRDEKSARRFFQLYLCADRAMNPIQLLKDCVYMDYPQYKEILDTLLALVE